LALPKYHLLSKKPPILQVRVVTCELPLFTVTLPNVVYGLLPVAGVVPVFVIKALFVQRIPHHISGFAETQNLTLLPAHGAIIGGVSFELLIRLPPIAILLAREVDHISIPAPGKTTTSPSIIIVCWVSALLIQTNDPPCKSRFPFTLIVWRPLPRMRRSMSWPARIPSPIHVLSDLHISLQKEYRQSNV